MKPSPPGAEAPESLEGPAEIARISLAISGRVQGVGFRPFVVRLARGLSLTGSVANVPEGVLLEIQGHRTWLGRFLEALASELPPRGPDRQSPPRRATGQKE